MSQPHEAETLLPPSALGDPATARSSVVDSLAPPQSDFGGDVRESQYSAVPLNLSYGVETPSPRTTSPQGDAAAGFGEKSYVTEAEGGNRSGKRRWFWVLAGLLALAVIVVAVIVPVYFKVIKPNNNSAQSNTGSTTDAPAPTQSGDPGTVPQASITGGDGSKVVTETGSFVYNNSFGGFWVQDPANPFNNNAAAQSWSPPLNTTWRWGVDKIRGCVHHFATICILVR
jgi:glucan 1,3-beta-glucosidase